MVESRALKAHWPLARPARLPARSRPGSRPRAGEREGHRATLGEGQHYDSVSSDRTAGYGGKCPWIDVGEEQEDCSRKADLRRTSQGSKTRPAHSNSLDGQARPACKSRSCSSFYRQLTNGSDAGSSYVVAFPPFPISIADDANPGNDPAVVGHSCSVLSSATAIISATIKRLIWAGRRPHTGSN